MRKSLFLLLPFGTAVNLLPHRIKASALRSLNTIAKKGLQIWPNTYESVLPAAQILSQIQPEVETFCQASEQRCHGVWKPLTHVRADLAASKLCNNTVKSCWSNVDKIVRDLVKTKVSTEHFSGLMILKSLNRLTELDVQDWVNFYEMWSKKVDSSSDIYSYIDSIYIRGSQLVVARTKDERRAVVRKLRETLYHPRGALMYVESGDVFSKSEYLLAVGEILSLMEDVEPDNLLDKGARLSLGMHIVDVLSNAKLVKDRVFDVLSNLVCALDKLSTPRDPLISVVVTGSAADETTITLSTPFRDPLTHLTNLTVTASPGSLWTISPVENHPIGNVYSAATNHAEARQDPSSLTLAVRKTGDAPFEINFNPIEYHRSYAELSLRQAEVSSCKLDTYVLSLAGWQRVLSPVAQLQPRERIFVQTSCMLVDATSDIELRDVQGHIRATLKPLLTPMGLTLVGFPADLSDLNKFGNHPVQVHMGNMSSSVLERSFPVEQKYDNEISLIDKDSKGLYVSSRDLEYTFPREIPSGNFLGATIFSLLVILLGPMFVYGRVAKAMASETVVVGGWKSGLVKTLWGGLVISGWLSLIYYWAWWKLIPYGRFLMIFVSVGLMIGMAMSSA